MTWLKLTFDPIRTDLRADDIDGLGCELIELGAASSVVEHYPTLTCYVETDTSSPVRAALIEHANAQGFTLTSEEEVKMENWHQACSEVWESIHAGTLTIVPVQSATDTRAIPDGALKLIPGQGFGTGHHPTTRMILEELSDLASHQALLPGEEILDLGTGSGILALAAARLFSIPVLGTDIEHAALENARENVKINNLEKLIRLEDCPLTEYKTPFAMIVANVYGEVLCALKDDLTRLAAPGSITLLSGITELVRDQVLAAYEGPLWKLVKERNQGEWVCLVLERQA